MKISILPRILTIGILSFFFLQTTQAQQKIKMTPAAEELKIYIEQYNKSKATLKNNKSTNAASNTRPPGVNPFTSFSSDRGNVLEWSEYNRKLAHASLKNNKKGVRKNGSIYNEKEREGATSNNTRVTAEPVPNIGSGKNQTSNVTIQGVLGSREIPDLESFFIDVEEDDGSIPKANNVNVTAPFQRATQIATIGDGLFGSSGSGEGDSDFYKLSLEKDDFVTISAARVDTSAVQPVMILFNALGQIEQFAVRPTDFSAITLIAPESGDYYVGVNDFEMLIKLTPATTDPFNSDSGAGFGNEGDYRFAVNYFGKIDRDFYSFDLKKGDVFSVAVDNLFAKAELYLNNGDLGVGTDLFAVSSIEESPILVNGNTAFAYIIPEDGTYSFTVTNDLGAYDANILVTRPGFETVNKRKKQLIYVDFTGTDFKQREFFQVPNSVAVGNPVLDQERFLSPFKDFLENWGIENTNINKLRTAYEIMQVVKENTAQDLSESGINPNFAVKIISDYGSDFLGNKIPKILEGANIDYSRVVVGGTIEESGIRTIGIANRIDPGNYSLNDDALVLLDLLSSTDSTNIRSINNIPRTNGATIEDLVPIVVGNIVSHEFGHYLGNYHSNVFNDVISIMDEGGPLTNQAGVLPGNVFGDENTEDVDFKKDSYSTRERFDPEGIDQIDVNTAYALGFTFFDKKVEDPIISELLKLETTVLKDLEEEVLATTNSFPNPVSSNGISYLKLGVEIKGLTKVDLYDLQGRKIKTLFNDVIKEGKSIEIKLNPAELQLTSGMYTYKIINEAGDSHFKIIVN